MPTLKSLTRCGLALTIASLTAGCQEATPVPPAPATVREAETLPTPEPPPLAEPTKVGEPTKRSSGLVYETVKEGSGPSLKSGDMVTVHCVASAGDAKPFFSTRDSNRPVSFKLGDARLIQGWSEGIAGMKVGERRKLTVPPNLAYGALGRMPAIPPNGALSLDIEALALGDPPADLKAQELGQKFTLPSTSDLYSSKNEWIDTPAKEKPKD
jgi:FKBP-type peptidyl-prolyl cis-trans isomerase